MLLTYACNLFYIFDEARAVMPAMPMKPMIDMRGFPDKEGLCNGAGFFLNKTDCTQFYR